MEQLIILVLKKLTCFLLIRNTILNFKFFKSLQPKSVAKKAVWPKLLARSAWRAADVYMIAEELCLLRHVGISSDQDADNYVRQYQLQHGNTDYFYESYSFSCPLHSQATYYISQEFVCFPKEKLCVAKTFWLVQSWKHAHQQRNLYLPYLTSKLSYFISVHFYQS